VGLVAKNQVLNIARGGFSLNTAGMLKCLDQPDPLHGEFVMMKLMMTAASAALLLMSGAASADQALAQKNACMSCHGVDKKIVGPAFKEVAAKYAGDKTAHDTLVAKVKTGGKGVWGPIPMPPSPQVKPEDASKIIDWVLSLK
jgi:cytochrome c